ncbi:MAG TPA: glycine/sarcosine/betaine reductase selenoprotein B family protein [Candidatus Limnocylindria bacterium]|nr:glycine/sarcosine/betaine reductase selenoprotein B family protein [Candidatus Limnocylindria bacterium]
MTEAPIAATEPEVRTSDGAIGTFAAAEVRAARAASYAEWATNVSKPEPWGHRTVVTRADPLAWTPLRGPLASCTVALVSTGGVHLASQPPFAIYDEAGDASSRAIPGDVPTSDLRFSHSHYATEDAMRDPNVMFPLDRLRELARDGVIGASATLHFGFMGFIPDPAALVSRTVPDAARALRERDVDVVVLTPG